MSQFSASNSKNHFESEKHIMMTSISISVTMSSNTTSNYGIMDPNRVNVIPAIVFAGIMIFFGMIGNGHALLLNIQRFREQKNTKHRRNPYVVFVLSLAILDIFSCLFIIPLDIVDMSTKFTLLHVNVCIVFRFCQLFVHFSSISHVILISIHCWRKVFHTNKRQIDRRLAYKMCFICHGLAFLVAIPGGVMSGNSIKTVNSESGPICFAVSKAYQDTMLPKVYVTFLAICFCSCLIVIGSLYVALIRYYWKVRQERKMVTGDKESKKDQGKTTKTLIILTVVFIINYIPFLIIVSIVVMSRDFRKGWNVVTFATYRVFVRFPYLNNVLNPVVYGFNDQEFRKRLKKMYTPLIEKNSF